MGVLIDPLQRLASMLADCKGFQSWVGCGTAAAAAARIHFEGFGSESDAKAMDRETLEAMRPYAIIYAADGRGWFAQKIAAANCWRWSGSATVVLSRSYDERQSISDHFVSAAKLVEPILSNPDDPAAPGLVQMAATAGYLDLAQMAVAIAGRPPIEDRATYGDAFDTVLYLEW